MIRNKKRRDRGPATKTAEDEILETYSLEIMQIPRWEDNYRGKFVIGTILLSEENLKMDKLLYKSTYIE